MIISKRLKDVNDSMDWTVLFIVWVRKEDCQMLSFVVTDEFYFILISFQFINLNFSTDIFNIVFIF